MRLRFLGTGASGGTPGRGRSRRLESSLLVEAGRALLVDVTRDFALQARELSRIDAVVLTHGHRDAVGGTAQLRRWWLRHGSGRPIDAYMNAETLRVLEARFARLDHLRPIVVPAGATLRLGDCALSAIEVPHARDPRFATFAWRLAREGRTVVYASDVARLPDRLERFSAGASMLVLDGAMWGRRLFSHLTIDEALPHVCRWRVEAITLTQIGRSAPSHEELERRVAELCPRARPAYDGLEITIRSA